MPDRALTRIVEAVGTGTIPEVLSHSPDGRTVAAFGAVVFKLGLPGEAARTAAKMRSVSEALGEHSPLVVPKLLWVREDVLAMERLSGESFRTLAAGRGAADATAFFWAGRGIAALHAVQPVGLPHHGLDGHIRHLLRPHPDQVGRALPHLAARITAIVRRVSTEISEPAERFVIHRDLHLGQLFATYQGVAVIDWDLCSLGDPALDLGNLRAYVHDRLPGNASAFWQAFVDGYGVELSRSVDLYASLMYLRMASKAFRLHGLEANERIIQLVVAAEACL